MGGDEDTLLGEVVHDNQDGGEAGGRWKLLNEVHRYGVPWALGDRELFEQAVRLVVRGFGMGTGGTGGHVVLNECANAWPGIIMADKL